MKWFKHMANASQDEKLIAMLDRYGLEGIGAFWVLLEVLASAVDTGRTAQVTMSVKQWRKRIPFAPQKLRNWLAYADQLALIRTTIDGDLITASCPKLLELCDNWTAAKGRTTKKVSLEVEVEVDEEVEVEEDKILPDRQSIQWVTPEDPAARVITDDPWIKQGTGEQYQYLFRCLKGKYQGILDEDVRKWEASHPLLNIREMLAHMQHECETNPWFNKSSCVFALSNWLTKQKNKATPKMEAKPVPENKPKPKLSLLQQAL